MSPSPSARPDPSTTTSSTESSTSTLKYTQYSPTLEQVYLSPIRQLISKDLSEPYSIYVYRYFLYQWGDLCFMTLDEHEQLVGVVVSKLEPHRGGPRRGYIAMLAVREEYRGQGIGERACYGMLRHVVPMASR